MAQRYGSKYSPRDGQDPIPHDAGDGPRNAFVGAQVDPVGFKANLMFLPGILLLLFSLGAGALSLVVAVAGAASLTLSAWLLREGLRAEAAYKARRVAKRPALPRKMVASVLTGVGIALAAYRFDSGIAASGIYGLVTMALHSVAFGIDPLTDKGMDGIDTFQQSRVAHAVGEAEAYLKDLRAAIDRTNDRALEARVERFQSTARELFRTVEDDPRDLASARKYLTVYLMGARDASVKFVDLYMRNKDTQARVDYLSLLDDLERNFAARTKALLLDDRSDLTVEIDVLRERLQREGVATQ
ncbi:5-bromo-4-chloroindolyl phosphate hydrolysis family protein [Chachezhania sediminis]|uniref:5-bromo-4-chloroindolyl phosphate hydrolysis family protein n=1 Tax=Chachezhania sediminis TaxID=2599291 RepID=UPI00131E93DD|nr:5-bromo-4-chloroindolyl phosphate hydrolysis family protein [Chachezhania sediminis]